MGELFFFSPWFISKKKFGPFQKKKFSAKKSIFPYVFPFKKKFDQKKIFFLTPSNCSTKNWTWLFPYFCLKKYWIFFWPNFFFDHQKPGFPHIFPFQKFCQNFFLLNFCWLTLKSAHRTPFTRQNVVIQKSKYFTPIFGVKSSISLYHHNRGGPKCFVSRSNRLEG